MKNFKKMLPYLGAMVLIFYVLPLLIQDTGSGMLVLLLGIPLLDFLAALACGESLGFRWGFPLLTVLLFVPSVFLFYNHTALVYVVPYGVLSLLGDLVGAFLKKRKQPRQGGL